MINNNFTSTAKRIVSILLLLSMVCGSLLFTISCSSKKEEKKGKTYTQEELDSANANKAYESIYDIDMWQEEGVWKCLYPNYQGDFSVSHVQGLEAEDMNPTQYAVYQQYLLYSGYNIKTDVLTAKRNPAYDWAQIEEKLVTQMGLFTKLEAGEGDECTLYLNTELGVNTIEALFEASSVGALLNVSLVPVE